MIEWAVMPDDGSSLSALRNGCPGLMLSTEVGSWLTPRRANVCDFNRPWNCETKVPGKLTNRLMRLRAQPVA